MMKTYLIDSDTITYLLQKKKDTVNKIKEALEAKCQILISAVVFYEVARGLYHKAANKQLAALETLVEDLSWLDLTKSTWDLGANLWADCRKQGTPTCDSKRLDADCLIAAQAKENKAIVVTKNTRHFSYLGIDCESW
jgi:predicted nucleic acid-binding protein